MNQYCKLEGYMLYSQYPKLPKPTSQANKYLRILTGEVWKIPHVS